MGDILETKLPIEDGTIPHTCFEPHRRGKNWVAVVVKNLQAPGVWRGVFSKRPPAETMFSPQTSRWEIVWSSAGITTLRLAGPPGTGNTTA
jgi:hypothetical protein